MQISKNVNNDVSKDPPIRRRVVEIWIKLTWAWGQGGKCLFLQWILHCGLTTLLTVVSVVVDNVYELLMLKFGYVERHLIGGLTLKGRVVETWRGIWGWYETKLEIERNSSLKVAQVISWAWLKYVLPLKGNLLKVRTLFCWPWI